jgi:lipopolysaccharide export LptBFGC system permease protein LptF
MKKLKNFKNLTLNLKKKKMKAAGIGMLVCFIFWCLATIGVFAAPREYIIPFCALMVMSVIGLIIAGAVSHNQTEEPSTSP